jgi:OOP family OmpA-OmpF porin
LGTTAQNLVPNPSFEDYHTCPTFNSNIQESLNNWYSPTIGTSDYFNKFYIDTTKNGRGVPYNYIYGFQYPKDGNGYVGLYLYYESPAISSHDYREYIAIELIDSLKKDTTYCVSVFTNLSLNGSSAISSDIQFYFSNDSLYDYSWPGQNNLNVNPQVVNDSENFISDTLNWILINGAFVSKGGEKFLTIGNFLPNNKSHIQKFDSANFHRSYYYFDEVSVIKGQCKREDTVKKVFFNLYPNPNNGNFNLNYGINNSAEFIMYDILGRVITRTELNKDEVIQEFKMPLLSNGIYFIRIADSNKELYSTKMIITR